MQTRILDTLGLSKSIIGEDEPETYDVDKTSAVFVRTMSKLLKWSDSIGTVKLELPEYVLQLTKVDKDIIITYMDHFGNPLFTLDKSKWNIYNSIASLCSSGIFD